ncbi:MAG: tetratricopeptide repeat protein [Acidobacteriota bacterium]
MKPGVGLPGCFRTRSRRQALKIDEKVYGPEHPEVAIDANNIGTILKAKGDLEGALGYTERALRIFESVYGADHPSTRIVAENLRSLRGATTGA